MTNLQYLIAAFSEEVNSDKELMVNRVDSKYITHFCNMRNRSIALAIFVSSLVFGIKDFEEIVPIKSFLLPLLIASLTVGIFFFLYYERKRSIADKLLRNLEVGYIQILGGLYYTKGFIGGQSLRIAELVNSQLNLFPTLILMLFSIRTELHNAFSYGLSCGILDDEDKTHYEFLAHYQENVMQSAYQMYKSNELVIKENELYASFLLSRLTPLIERYRGSTSQR
jgi:hypothetical protein